MRWPFVTRRRFDAEVVTWSDMVSDAMKTIVERDKECVRHVEHLANISAALRAERERYRALQREFTKRCTELANLKRSMAEMRGE